jgi:hypothetical protein
VFAHDEAVVTEADWALSRALVPRGAVRHLRTCLARHVNSTVYPCSPECLRAQAALAQLRSIQTPRESRVALRMLARCAMCNAPMRGKRSVALTCSSACRQKAYRARGRAAR